MAESPDDFRNLLDGVLAGQPGAAEQFCRLYQSHILRVVRRRMMKQMRLRYDSADFVQDVWASFFAEPPKDHQFHSAHDLIGYLERMTQFKVGERVRQHTGTERHNILNEERIDDENIVPERDLVARQPSPSQEYYAREEWEQMLQSVSPEHQPILRLLQDGLTHAEIADRLRTDEKTVQRLLRRVERKRVEWDQWLAGLPEIHQRILRLLRQGLGRAEVAERLQLTESHLDGLLTQLPKTKAYDV